MTSKSTLLSNPELKLAGLVEHELIVPLAEKDKKRWVFVTPEIDDLLSGRLNPAAAFPSVAADVTLGRFSRNLIVSLTRKMSDNRSDLKQLVGLNEAWVMKLPGPGSGWRMFGRFARKNVFVGLDCRERGDCAPLTVYNQRALDMIADWEGRWAEGPLTGLKPEHYVGQPFYAVDW